MQAYRALFVIGHLALLKPYAIPLTEISSMASTLSKIREKIDFIDLAAFYQPFLHLDVFLIDSVFAFAAESIFVSTHCRRARNFSTAAQ